MKLGVYLINLDSSVDRLKQADAELKKHHMDYIRISAVDGRQLDVQNFDLYNAARSNAYTGRDLIGSEIGCYLSHKKALETFVNSDADYGLILEDDLKLNEDFNLILKKSLSIIQKQNINWAVINVAANKKKLAREFATVQQYGLFKAYYFPILALGLLWTKRGAQQFLSEMKEIYTPIDVEIQAWACETGLGLSIYPAIVQPSGVDSDIDANTLAQKKNSLRIDRFAPRQKRMWRNKLNAIKHLYFKSN
ncbi:glycosyltransferase family 25 protein [Acinetobacter sp. LH3_13]|uniref:glycosyltransferase family 25 protein n=1 Tax=Acinetobacter sp. LH3_13 TaxID=3434463 RepID=UPI003EC12688